MGWLRCYWSGAAGVDDRESDDDRLVCRSLLYELALTDYERVFRDVVIGDNDVYHLGCCYAAPGYDMASGLGSIRFDELAAVLLERGGGR